MADEKKDRFGEKMKEVERAREDLYFKEEDRRLVEKLRRGQAGTQAAQEVRMICPKCGETLLRKTVHEIAVDECPTCKGIWLNAGEFEELAKTRNAGWLERLLGGR